MAKRNHGRYSDPLTIDQTVQGVTAAIENADQLIDDAKLLLKNGRYARAFSLAVLAEEETAKVLLLIGSLTTTRRPQGWSKFWKRFRSHNAKYMDALWLDSILIENGDELKKYFQDPSKLAHYIDLLKQMAFYTEFDRTNKRFLKP